jgi:hypothetical protein
MKAFFIRQFQEIFELKFFSSLHQTALAVRQAIGFGFILSCFIPSYMPGKIPSLLTEGIPAKSKKTLQVAIQIFL